MNRPKDSDQELQQPDPNSVTEERQASFFRQQCIREIGRLMGKLNDTTVNESKLRSYNNQVNKLLQRKSVWSQRIIALGGRIPLPPGSKIEDEIAIDRTYRYFGLAKLLPGVQELLSEKKRVQELANIKHQSRASLYQQVELDYFEFHDTIDADLALAQMELEAEQKTIDSLSNSKQQPINISVAKLAFPFPTGIPNRQTVEKYLVELKKKQLLNKYTT